MIRLHNPVAVKRWRRFKERKRAYGALWLLLILYAVSLASELLCNDRPLYLRHAGRTFFPAFRYYPEDAFLHNGAQTRPDYLKLATTPAFRPGSGNLMIFPPVRCSPYASIAPDSLGIGDRCALRLTVVPRAASADVSPNGRIIDSVAPESLFGADEIALHDRPLADFWTLPPEVADAIARRFRNEAAPAVQAAALNRTNRAQRAYVTLPPFQPRATPPRSVRLTFRDELTSRLVRHTFILDREGAVVEGPHAFFEGLDKDSQRRLREFAARCFTAPVPPATLLLGGVTWQVHAERKTVSWPHPPVRGHWLGIDGAGRDVLARLLYGLRTSMTFGILLVIATMAVGICVGAVQGYYAGKVDITAQRLIEIWSALPFLYIMILLGSVYGRSFMLLLFCYGMFNWIGVSYYIRGEFLRLRHLPYVDAARCLGVPARRIIFTHILPNALTPVITLFPFLLVGAIGALTALDYLGFGLPSPTPSWGDLLQQAQQYRWAWWLILYPSLMLFVVMLLGVFLGEGIRDAYDPRRHSRLV